MYDMAAAQMSVAHNSMKKMHVFHHISILMHIRAANDRVLEIPRRTRSNSRQIVYATFIVSELRGI